ncbi:MAG TPA: potassium transporter Kup [Thermoanaerobaculia bacterium]|nr:potassium transporter Kup [Thermoanaerobaculia bacterium]
MSHDDSHPSAGNRFFPGLVLGALGVVYGDIGTSPLYALREVFEDPDVLAPTRGNVLGILSLVFWALILVITVKYLVFVMRADNRGEGGILALMALIPSRLRDRRGGHWILVALGLFGAALLYGDGMITPAVSVLSAVEGLQVATHLFDPYVIAITIAILIGLFVVQRRGTAGIGAVFGPVMLLWFATLAVLGISWIVKDPHVLAAVNPVYAVRFFLENRVVGFLALGSVFLVVTGGEALYADMGHFGRKPIQIAWFALVLPALLLNYFGQGALLLHNPEAVHNPFYRMAPSWSLYPLVALAASAAVIASQAVISGAFSLTRQAVQLGYSPRVSIVHTSEEEIGQIYIPSVNWLLMLSTLGLVLGFRESTNLAGAYGVAVTATMVITTVLASVVERRVWGWRLAPVLLFTVFFLAIDLAFFGANIVKVAEGGWFPLAVGLLIYTLMSTWKKGRSILSEKLASTALPFETFIATLKPESLPRAKGTAVFMSREAGVTPPALLHNLKHNQVLHERVILLTVMTEEIPQVPREERLQVETLGKGFYSAIARYGFLESPEMPELMELCRGQGLDLKIMSTTFFLSRETLIPSRKPSLMKWREVLFALMLRNAQRPNEFFRIPANRVVELGMQVQL